jgi:2-polyprenyl-6-methoxyphenol hydroxylase-like FAD-dependent oxidoreductase
MLESLVRRRVLDLDRITVVEGVEVTGLVERPGGVAGIHLRDRGDRVGATQRREDADLVVDASGRASRAPDWLDALGYGRPEETVIDALLGYASRQYEPPAGWRADWKGVYLMAQPPAHTRTGIMFPIEGGRWLLSLMGAGGDYPPTDEEGFEEFARSLRSPVIGDAIRHARPVSDITGYRRTENRRRHYERMRRWPDGLAVVGDAACAFNPVYGSGMSVAARTAVALDEALAGGRELRGFQRTAAARGAAAWLLATGEDLRYPTTIGSRATIGTRLLHRYLDRVILAATAGAATNEAFVSVMTLLRTPDILFRPGVVLDALRHHDPLTEPPSAVAAPLPLHAEVA